MVTLTAPRARETIAQTDQGGRKMARMMADCRRWPSDINCSLTIIGEEDEVVDVAAMHAASAHGHEDTPEMREQMRGMLEPAETYSNEPRAHEPLPG
jgi:predicted small metal-binding protein